eukprot:NODE_2649_length_457_cov_372.225490_g2193_i0.p1 GENE.NODE_2649_length_457_cov_372.225490_g2193_i0~~NODE_2649_length_457_cov_372.225490_g2193_i0.p1  ORF type:complete len:75 (-),score=13.55 NODE_2649_length_457_cov_372.225490_g2193_i0:167-391(-)
MRDRKATLMVAIEQERAVREQTEETFICMFEGVVSRLKQQIDEAKHARAAGEERLINTMGSLCARVSAIGAVGH